MAIKKSVKPVKKRVSKQIPSAQLRIKMWEMLRACAVGEEQPLLKIQRELHKFPKDLRNRTFKECATICKGVWELHCMADPLDRDKYNDKVNKAAKIVADTVYDQQEVRWAYDICMNADHKFRLDMGLVKQVG